MSDKLRPHGLYVARQAPLSMGVSRQEDWSGLPCPPPGHLLYLGTEPGSPALAGVFFTTEPPTNPLKNTQCCSHKNSFSRDPLSTLFSK